MTQPGSAVHQNTSPARKGRGPQDATLYHRCGTRSGLMGPDRRGDEASMKSRSGVPQIVLTGAPTPLMRLVLSRTPVRRVRDGSFWEAGVPRQDRVAL